MFKTHNFDWRGYEAITKYIYETLGKEFGVKIEGYGINFKVTGKSGVNHQIDVLTSSTDGIHSYQTAIECKYWKKKINKDIVMKVSKIIEDARINKGIIVSKSGFTKDAFDFAEHCNIGLVELREIEEKDQEVKSREFEIGNLEISQQISILRPEILKVSIECKDKVHNEPEMINIYSTTIRLSNGNQIPFHEYTKAFQNELHHQKKLFQIITKRYEIIGGSIIDLKTNSSTSINGIIFTGVLKKKDSNSNLNFSLVDRVWLIMKSIFEERTFSISENGIIFENKKC